MKMNLPELFGLKVNEDPCIFINEVNKITQIMHVTEEVSVEFKSQQLKDIAYNQITVEMGGRGEHTTPISWNMFQPTFMGRFFPREMRKSKVESLLT